MITFTIITVTYNAEDVLKRTLNSIKGQLYRNIEHLIIDGASKDNTLKIAEEYREMVTAAPDAYSIRIISEPDNGLYDAMNKGLRMATGNYLCFMNAGDSLASADTLQTIVSNCKLEEKEGDKLPAVLYGDTAITDNEGVIIGRRHHTPPERLTWRSFRHGMLVCHQAFYARTDIAQKFCYDLQYRHSSDVDWCINIMREAERLNLELANAHATVALYQREGQTTVYRRKSLMERYHIMCKHYGKTSTILMHIWFVFRALTK